MTKISDRQVGKLSNIQALRGIAALLVVLSHIRAAEISVSGKALLPNILQLGICGVDLFFVISGFIMVYVTQRTPETLRASGEFVLARAARIYPLYWLILAALLGLAAVAPAMVNGAPYSADLTKSVLLLPDGQMPALDVAWTLIHEMYFYLVFGAILLCPRQYRIPSLASWVSLTTLAGLSGVFGNGPIATLVFNPLNIEFALGAFIAHYLLTSRSPISFHIGKICLATWGVSLAIYLGFFSNEYAGYWQRVLLFGVPSAVTIYTAAVMERRNQLLPKFITKLGDQSYSLYLSHLLVIGVLSYGWAQWGGSGSIVENLAVIPVMLAAILCTSWVVWRSAESPLIALNKRLRRSLKSIGTQAKTAHVGTTGAV